MRSAFHVGKLVKFFAEAFLSPSDESYLRTEGVDPVLFILSRYDEKKRLIDPFTHTFNTIANDNHKVGLKILNNDVLAVLKRIFEVS